MTQVVELRLKPIGNEGVILQPVMAAPLLLSVVGVTVMATATVPLVPLDPT